MDNAKTAMNTDYKGRAETITNVSSQVRFVVFKLDDQRYALPLGAVERIVRAVEITLLPDAPKIVLGVVDVEGRVLPVLNVRRRFGLPEVEVGPDHQYLIARTAAREVMLVVDEALGVVEHSGAAVIAPSQIVSGLGSLQGVMRLDDGLVLIHDLEKFLALDEAQALDHAMAQS
jgi:purine-binding chemotaxis protein CheW